MEGSISSMKASTEASTEAFTEASTEAFTEASTETFMEAGSHGSFHELPRKKQVVQQTGTSAHSGTRTINNRQR